MSYKTRDQRIADDVMGDYLPCSFCQKPTLGTILSQYGARCIACYEAFGPKGARGVAPALYAAHKMRGLFAFKVSDPKAWARTLKAREESGERLTQMQKTMWRSALGTEA